MYEIISLVFQQAILICLFIFLFCCVSNSNFVH